MSNFAYQEWVTPLLVGAAEKERSPDFRNVWTRLLTWPEGEYVHKSIKRHLKQLGSPEFHVLMLMSQARNWQLAWKYDVQLRPTERFQLVQDVVKNASKLQQDLARLGMSWKVHDLVDDEKLNADLVDFLRVFSVEDEVEEDATKYFEDLQDMFRKIGSDAFLQSTMFNLYNLLELLTDQKIVSARALDSVLSKVDSPTSERVYVIRRSAEAINALFGRRLEETVANFSAVILNDPAIDRDTVRSALKGFVFKELTEKNAEYGLNLALRGNILEDS